MTLTFWSKRPSKKLIATLLFFMALATVFFYRQPIAVKSIEYFTEAYDLKVTCLNFSIDWQLNLNIKQACINAPLAKVEIRQATWQPWSNDLTIEQVKVKHFAIANKIDKTSSGKPQTNELNVPDSLPKLHISRLEIDSFVLLQSLNLSVNPTSSNKLNITGDVNASIEVRQNSLVGHIDWRLSDLTKLLPQAQKLSRDNPELLKDLALDESKIKTSFIYNGKTLKADSNVDIGSRLYVANCPIEASIKGNILVDVNLSSLNIDLNLSQLSTGVSAPYCPLLQDYFAKDNLPQLSFIFAQKISIDETQINLPSLHIIDKQNAHTSIALNALSYKTSGELAVNYNISVKQPVEAKQIQLGMLDLQAQGTLSADISKKTPEQPIDFRLTGNDNQLIIKDLKIDSLLLNNLTSKFSMSSAANQLVMKGTINSSGIQMNAFKITKSSSDFSVSGPSLDNLQLSVNNQLCQLGQPDLRVQNVSNHLDINIKKFDLLSFSGDTTFTKLSAQNINFRPIDITHTGQGSLANKSISSQHVIQLERGFVVELEQQQTQAKIQIKQQNIIALQNVISQLENPLVVKKGKLAASIELTLPQEDQSFFAQGNADFQGVSAKYQDYLLNNMTYHTPLIFDSAGLQLNKSTLHIESIDVGVPIQQLKADVIAKDNVLHLEQVQGEIFKGKFFLSDLWLDGREQQFNINIQNIDLAEVVALQQQPGIQITGNINGDMPFIMGEQGVRVEDGWVSSLSGGKLTIVDNPSFDSIKDQQPELALLENLEFTQLESNVKFSPDGWVFFDFALQGNNPDKKQSVNFNYSHQENIFSLLESIRLVKSVENKIEQKITQGDKK